MSKVDAVLMKVSEMGKYQLLVVTLLVVPCCFGSAFSRYSFVFQFFTPDFCCVPENRTTCLRIDTLNASDATTTTCVSSAVSEEFNGTIAINVPCRRWLYDSSYFSSTFVTRWNLVCDQAIYPKSVISIAIACGVIGSFPLSYLQDFYGRKPAFVVCIILYIVGHVSSLFVPSLIAFVLTRSISSFTFIAMWNACSVWAFEFIGPSKRALVSCLLAVYYGLAASLLALIAWLCRTEVQLGLATSLPFVACLIYPFILYESPQFLVINGGEKQIVEILQKMCRWEGRELSPAIVHEILSDSGADSDPEQVVTKDRLRTVFTSRSLILKMVLCSVVMASVVVTYNSISYDVEHSDLNLYVAFTLQALMETFAGLSEMPMLQRLGRIPALFVALFLAGVFAFSFAPFSHYVMKYFICCGYITCGLYINEVFPTSARTMCLSFCQAFAELCTMIAPYIVLLGNTVPMAVNLVTGSLCFVSAALVLLLPETLDTCLPESLEQSETTFKAGVGAFRANVKSMGNRITTLTNALRHTCAKTHNNSDSYHATIAKA